MSNQCDGDKDCWNCPKYHPTYGCTKCKNHTSQNGCYFLSICVLIAVAVGVVMRIV